MAYPKPHPQDTSVLATATRFAVLTPSNTEPVPDWVRALWVAAQGTVVYRNEAGGPDISLGTVPAATPLNDAPHFLAAGTTATVIGRG